MTHYFTSCHYSPEHSWKKSSTHIGCQFISKCYSEPSTKLYVRRRSYSNMNYIFFLS